MLISYPLLPPSALDQDEDVYLDNILQYVLPDEGKYPISDLETPNGTHHRWHGGVHLAPNGEPIRAIADGTVVAFRFSSACETYGALGDYDTSFVLLKHETETGENTPVVFYSLYMHLANHGDLLPNRFAQLPKWLRQATPSPNVQHPTNHKVWRKDVLGFAGQLYNRETCHFEVFMLDASFQGVWKDSASVTQGNGSDDWFGDAHFVIPVNRTFVARHPRLAASGSHHISFANGSSFPMDVGQGGVNQEELYVSVRLSQGKRVSTTFRTGPNRTFEQVGAPIEQDNYEYELYHLATALYPDCPSAGFEWLRFGRVLGPDTTTRNENWQLVRYSDSEVGYIDLAPQAIAKLSDADFPHWLGWKRRDEGQTANVDDGLCDDPETLQIVQDASAGSESLKRHLICKAPSEWNHDDIDARYARLREPGEPLESSESWTRFVDHVTKLAFWQDAGLTERAVWHFHPMQFVRHFRSCGWLNEAEFAQCIPRRNRHLNGTQFHPQLVATWQSAIARARNWKNSLNRSARKYSISQGRQRLAHFLAQVTEESGYYQYVVEGAGANASYAPYYGRGLIQLTHLGNYRAYGSYRNFGAINQNAAPPFQALSWNPNQLLASTNQTYNAENCADSAMFYWTCPEITATGSNALIASDSGTSFNEVISASRITNGNVPLQNINGLGTRIQAFVYLKYVLLDFISPGRTETISFSWRRNSSKEPLFYPNGQPILLPNGHQKRGYILGNHTIDVYLDRQQP